MREKELRLALVCFGGVSLAIYIHGVSKEILKLVRASKALHMDPDPDAESRKRYIYPNENITDIPDTELVYYDILKSFSPELDLRVIIDTIAGASAGGMNSVFLGRAIAHDLNFDHLRHHWLIEADVSTLTGNKPKASKWEKMITKPLINLFSGRLLGNSKLRQSVKEKLPALLNISDLKPPFDGKHLLKLVYNGLVGMGDLNRHSLLPRGHQLDLFVTLTDFYGYKRTIHLNDPAFISEQEHRHNLKFSYLKKTVEETGTLVETDFDDEDLPSLSFAARATACFPGAFPPAQLRETDNFMKDLGKSWAHKDTFIKTNFKEYILAGVNPELTSFLDGSILNNKPFDQAIDAIKDRPAFREVSRRVIYVDPNPERQRGKAAGAPPALLNTLKGALSDIPMNEPMHDDLQKINFHNQKVKTIRTVVDSVKPSVQKLVFEVSPKNFNKTTSAKDIEDWRNMASARAVTEAGYSYEAYARLKIRSTVSTLSRILCKICDLPEDEKIMSRIYALLQCWALKEESDGSLLFGDDTEDKGLFTWTKSFIKSSNTIENVPFWATFVINFDIDYQKRRIQFLIQELNAQYPNHPDHVVEMDNCKMALYNILEKIKYFDKHNQISDDQLNHIKQTVSKIVEYKFTDEIQCKKNQSFVESNHDDIEKLLKILTPYFGLDHIRNETDQLISTQLNNSWNDEYKHALTTSYLGFAFWDVITFSIMGAKSIGEFNEILVNRISPNDDLCLKSDPHEMPLKGTAMKSFGAFFSREDRENDYIWGRFNGAERLIDLLYQQAQSEGLDHKIDLIEQKKKAFNAILDAEKEYLKTIPDLFDKIRKRIDQL